MSESFERLRLEKVRDVMREAISVKSDDKLLDALNTMERSGLEELPVVNDQGMIVGEIHGLEILIEIRVCCVPM